MGTLGGTLGSTLGPFLRFERFESPATWQGSVLVVSCLRDNDVNPTVRLRSGGAREALASHTSRRKVQFLVHLARRIGSRSTRQETPLTSQMLCSSKFSTERNGAWSHPAHY